MFCLPERDRHEKTSPTKYFFPKKILMFFFVLPVRNKPVTISNGLVI